MDPQAAVRRILEATTDAAEFTAACEDLAEWIDAGGFRPIVPAGTPFIPGTGTQWALLAPGPYFDKEGRIVRGGACYRLRKYSRNGNALIIDIDIELEAGT